METPMLPRCLPLVWARTSLQSRREWSIWAAYLASDPEAKIRGLGALAPGKLRLVCALTICPAWTQQRPSADAALLATRPISRWRDARFAYPTRIRFRNRTSEFPT